MLTAMFLSACKGSASPNPPRSWGHFATVTWIYALLNLVEELSSTVRKIRIHKHIDRWIRHYNCIPRYIPSIGIPSQLFETGKRTLKTMLREASRHIRHPAARAHLLKHTKFHRGMVLRWSRYEQGAKTCKAFTYAQLHPLDQVRRYQAQMRSLLCVGDFWKLPISGSHDLLEEWARSSLRDWARNCRLLPGARTPCAMFQQLAGRCRVSSGPGKSP